MKAVTTAIPDTAAACVYCRAPAGQSCRTRAGNVRAEIHAMRKALVNVMRTSAKRVRRAA